MVPWLGSFWDLDVAWRRACLCASARDVASALSPRMLCIVAVRADRCRASLPPSPESLSVVCSARAPRVLLLA